MAKAWHITTLTTLHKCSATPGFHGSFHERKVPDIDGERHRQMTVSERVRRRAQRASTPEAATKSGGPVSGKRAAVETWG